MVLSNPSFYPFVHKCLKGEALRLNPLLSEAGSRLGGGGDVNGGVDSFALSGRRQVEANREKEGDVEEDLDVDSGREGEADVYGDGDGDDDDDDNEGEGEESKRRYTLVLRGLLPGTTYLVLVRAVSPAGSGDRALGRPVKTWPSRESYFGLHFIFYISQFSPLSRHSISSSDGVFCAFTGTSRLAFVQFASNKLKV
ncbi:unnamed protein product [Protopolystoma xenopodis]|uniref:Uncharacterized protein n=1 Tax=Protopolystoma xenopodis TaxID=117903 RepID=A0A3S5BYX5_9PLAT|nr:unnamed protein product [Protopolystoma xenopodis]